MILSDNETKIDLLNNEAIAKTIVTLVWEKPEHPVTVGVHGDWGAGKSSVLEVVEACQRDVASATDLIREAEWLWSAEDNNVPSLCCSSPKQSISATWGCVALLGNPRSEILQNLFAEWAKHVTGHYTRNERRLVDDRGMLRIPWPKLSSDGSPVPMDLLLATSNDRDATYPTVREIAEAWNQHPEVDYFRSNRKHEIETFQDRAIRELLR
ncbi:MAG: P-loop NTPase fold protein [Candidatus Sulfotelmatobacter sp.]|jgi:hypothetical protein